MSTLRNLETIVSASGQKWRAALTETQDKQAERLAAISGQPLVVCRALVKRGISAEQVDSYLNPRLRDLMPNPSTLTDMDKACAFVSQAILAGKSFSVFGDFDVDGATSVAILVRYLDLIGIAASFYIPDRLTEGYGPNAEAMQAIRQAGADVCLMLDCGTLGFEALAHARTIGLAVVVIDHHQAGESLPECAALINPNREDDLSGLGCLCAAGVSFMFIVGLNRALREAGFFKTHKEPDLIQLLDLVALGTVCDVVPLTGLNRAFVQQGLKVMQQGQNVGLEALRRAARAEGPPNPYHLGFLLGPRINAGGRIGAADMGARLLTLKDPHKAEYIAAELDTLNSQRQAIELEMVNEALTDFPDEIGHEYSFMLAQGDGWHPGIVGLVASRLKERYGVPALAIAFEQEGNVGSGSARSITGVDLGRAVRQAVDKGLLLKGGGHAMAAGFKIERQKIEAFSAFLEATLCKKVADTRLAVATEIEGLLSASAANLAFLDILEAIGPFGAGNPEPMFLFTDHLITNVKIVGQGHVSLMLRDANGSTLKAICFRSADRPLGAFLQAHNGRKIHVLGTLKRSFWQGQSSANLYIADAALQGD